jgi:hypothetical protein
MNKFILILASIFPKITHTTIIEGGRCGIQYEYQILWLSKHFKIRV